MADVVAAGAPICRSLKKQAHIAPFRPLPASPCPWDTPAPTHHGSTGTGALAIADVTIMGAGIFGLSVAWVCLGRGARVRVIDPDGIGAGASGGVLGALAPHTPDTWTDTKQLQFEGLITAGAFWSGVDAASGHPSGYGRIGRLQPIADARGLALARTRAEQAKTLWRGLADWAVIPAGEAGDWAPRSATGWLIRDTLSARICPRRACTSLAAAIRAGGGEITRDGERQGRVIRATGYQGLQETTDRAGRPLGAGVKGQAALLRLDAQGVPQVFADGLHVVPHADGTVAVGSTSEPGFEAPRTTDGALEQVIATARAACPALGDAPVIERWAGVRPKTRSRAPILGPHPGREQEFIANGGFRIGFAVAHVVAGMMADLVLDGQDRIPLAFRAEARPDGGGAAF